MGPEFSSKPVASPDTKAYRFDRFTLDMRAGCVRSGDTAVPLRPKAFDVLVHLVRNPGRLVTKDELLASAWPDVAVTENSLVQCIKDVRAALGDDAHSIVETVARRGYRFLPAVVEIDAPPRAAGRSDPIAEAASAGASDGRPAVASSARRVRSRQAALVVAIGAATALLIAAGLRWGLGIRADSRSAPDRRLSVAVLPFARSDVAATDDYLSKGISDDIAAALGRFSDLAVASPRVVSRVQGASASEDDIERQLNVRYVVEGGVRRAADRVRVTVRLTDLPRRVLVWSQSYDEPADRILAVEDEIAARIAGALAVKLTDLEAVRVAHGATGSMEAYDFGLRGRELLTRLNRARHSQARAMFERAIALDPGYSAAYVGLGRVDLSSAALGWTPDAGEALKRAESLARQAISLDESNPAAHVLLGRVYARSREYDRAVDVLHRAVSLNPSDPDSYAGLGDALLWRGDLEPAIKALETATAIDDHLSGEDLFSLGAAYFLAGRSVDAARVLERVTTRNEGNPFVYAMLAAVYADSARDAESRAASAEVRKLNPFFDAELFGSLFNRPEHRERITAAVRKAGL